jgi:hypothetical protein
MFFGIAHAAQRPRSMLSGMEPGCLQVSALSGDERSCRLLGSQSVIIGGDIIPAHQTPLHHPILSLSALSLPHQKAIIEEETGGLGFQGALPPAR